MNSILTELAGGESCWAMERGALQQLMSRRLPDLEHRRGTPPLSAAASMGGDHRVVAGTAIIPIFGPMAQYTGWITEDLGGVSTEAVGNAIDRLAADPAIKNIVLVANSPGGEVRGMVELAARVRAAASVKPVIAQVSSLAASACFWAIAGASEIVSAPTALQGSIGIIAIHADLSVALEMQGVRPTILTSSNAKFKSEGNEFQPLGDAARSDLQSKLDQYESMFHRDIAAGRGVSTSVIRDKFGSGRLLTSAEALRAGMVDKIATLQQTLTDIRQAGNGSSLRGSSTTAGGRRYFPGSGHTDRNRRALQVEQIERDDCVRALVKEERDAVVRQVEADQRRYESIPARQQPAATYGTTPAERRRRADQVEREQGRRR